LAGTPISLSEVEEKVKKHRYETGYHFNLDIRSVLTNSWLNAEQGSKKRNQIGCLSKYFDDLILSFNFRTKFINF